MGPGWHGFGRAWLLALVCFGICGLQWVGGAEAAEVRRPNVILILTDDQSPRNPPTPEYPQLVAPPGFGYGGDRMLTPNVDRLAREGINPLQPRPPGLHQPAPEKAISYQ